jgi:hypothetical protein
MQHIFQNDLFYRRHRSLAWRGLAVILTALTLLSATLMAAIPPANAATAADLLANPRVALSENAKKDLRDGQVDAKLIDLLTELSASHTFLVSVFITGHSQFTSNGSVSYHWYGRAADIFKVDGADVNYRNMNAQALAERVKARTDQLRPTELGQPWWNGTCGSIECFTKDHGDHIHIGYAQGSPSLQTVFANVNACGALYIKLSTWGAWEQHMGCGQAKAVAVSPDGQTIAVVRPDNTLVAKNAYWGQWSQHVGVGDTQATAAGPGGMLANVNACGALYIKRSYWGAWEQHMGCGQAKAVAVSPDGQTIAVVRPDNTLVAKNAYWGQWSQHVGVGDTKGAALGRA